MSGNLRLDFHVIPKAKMFSVHGRRSEWDGQEWHWVDGWHLANFRTHEKAQASADDRNRRYGGERGL